jgi:kinesin family protein 6/9
LDEDAEGKQRLNLVVPKEINETVNNKREQFRFRFDGVFDQKAVQAEVFEAVAQPTVDSVIGGYNATLFAYGQTGSGKTFTMTGGPERFEDRGLIPRSLERIFTHAEKHAEREFTVAVSYLEIYNEVGYDLLDSRDENNAPSNQPVGRLEDLPKVTLFEDADANIHVKNLSVHVANNVEEALNLLFVGDTNRMVAEVSH